MYLWHQKIMNATNKTHTNGGTIEEPADAFEMVRWFSEVIRDAYVEQFGRGLEVKATVQIKGLTSTGCDHPENSVVYERHGDEVMAVRCDKCGEHL